MITIEVLVSMLILFLVIATSFENIKFFNMLNEKKLSYEEQYITVLSLKDKLSLTVCKTSQREEGEFNGFTYIATCEKKKELRSFEKGFDIDDPSGNIGNYLIKLYEVNLQLKQGRINKIYHYIIIRSDKLL